MKRLITAMLTAAMVMAPVTSYAMPTPQGYMYNDYGCVILSTDGTDATVPQYLSDIAPGETVYYRVSSKDGYVCSSLKINAVSAGENAFIMPEGELVIEPDYRIRGDANHDGKLNISDVSMILRSIIEYGWEYWTIDKNAADFNRDGKVNLSDASVIMRKIAAFDEGGRISSDSGYSVTNLADATFTGYMLTETNGPFGIMGIVDISNEPITSVDELRYFTKKLMSSVTEFKAITEDGSMEPTDLTPASFMAQYTDEFFEKYDIIPIVTESNRAFTIDAAWDTPTRQFPRFEIACTGGELVYPDQPQPYYENADLYAGCFLYVMVVPKGVSGEWTIYFPDGENRPEYYIATSFI